MANDIEKEVDVEVDDGMADDSEPIYFKPKTVSLVSAILPWISWVVLVVFVLVIIAQIQYLLGIATQNGTTLSAMLTDP